MADKYQTFDMIEEITRIDGSKYFEIGNIFMNGRAELAVNKGYIKQVRIVQLNIPHSNAVIRYEAYVNETYAMPTVDETDWEEWSKDGEMGDVFTEILKANHIG